MTMRSIVPRENESLVVGGVIGDVLDPFTSSISIRVTYSNHREVINGLELKPSHVASPPRVDVGGDDLRTFFTLIMVDPDAPNPSNPSMREYLHWLVTDIPATTGPSFEGRQMVDAAEWRRQNFNTRDFAMLSNLGPPVAALFFNCQRQSGSGGRRI
ncbi:protein FLOWERING LOCUS T-like isoform X2 [Prosopis cineraria]|uniref:protein FLOWERING LOCUS T-like isoform X2 n=1 Tax=Prosopis cineraria TaxID=364024 RepID=UPI0024101FE3|nr:protein FLOWERING LOCUS T-like isoform X2 [Prosopis cineraria]